MKRRQLDRVAMYLINALAFVGASAVIFGGIMAIAGAALPWANALLFGSLQISLPGLVFVLGSVAAACGAGALFLSRYPLICLAIGLVLLVDTSTATKQIPRAVRGELLDAQKGFFPINSLLGKFDIDFVMVGNYGAKDSDYIGIGVQRAALGGLLILFGSVLGLPRDPWLRRAGRRVFSEKCDTCGAKWPIGRDATYCPKCAAPTYRAEFLCCRCTTPLMPSDKYCVRCGFPKEPEIELTTSQVPPRLR
jgi:hypothetical protein